MTESMMNGMHLQLPMNLNSDLFWRYPLSLNALTPTATFGDSNLKLPKSLGLDPRTWNREDVAIFLQWCKSEFDLPALDIEKFKMNGKALILLNKSDISQRAPGTGDVIHNILQLLLKPVAIRRGLEEANLHSGHNNNTHLPASLMGWPSPTSLLTPAELHSIIQQRNSAALSPPASAENRSQPGSPPRSDPATAAAAAAVAAHLTLYTQALQASLQAAETHSDSEEDPQESSPRRSPTSASCYPKASASPPVATSVDTPDSGSNGRLLWDFLQQLLNDPGQRYTAYIAWKNRETGVFKITDPPGLARLWGFQKNHPSMNYDKMSRALRYYYRVNILRKVQGERHCYQFLRNNNELKSVKSLSQLRHEAPGTLSSKLEENNENLAGYDYSISSKMKMVP